MFGLTRMRPALRVLRMRTFAPICARNKATQAKQGYQYIWEKAEAKANFADATGWAYKDAKETSKRAELIATGMMTLLWWWLLVHMYYQGHTLAGHYWQPSPRKFTDAELGIPSDDEE